MYKVFYWRSYGFITVIFTHFLFYVPPALILTFLMHFEITATILYGVCRAIIRRGEGESGH